MLSAWSDASAGSLKIMKQIIAQHSPHAARTQDFLPCRGTAGVATAGAALPTAILPSELVASSPVLFLLPTPTCSC